MAFLKFQTRQFTSLSLAQIHETITKIKMTNSRDLDFRYRRPHYRPMKLMQKLFVLIMLMKVLNTCVSYKIAVAILTADALN